MRQRPDLRDVDCVWLGCDRDGHVAAFVTGGSGPVPDAVLDLEEPRVEELEELVCGLPRTSAARLLVSVKRPDSFVEMAERGFFVYDWTDVYRTAREVLNEYEPVALPVNPVGVDQLPAGLAKACGCVRFAGVSFGGSISGPK